MYVYQCFWSQCWLWWVHLRCRYKYEHSCLISAYELVWICCICGAHFMLAPVAEAWYIKIAACFSLYVYTVIGICRWTTAAMQLDLFMQCSRYICSWAYANNMNCICAPDHILICCEYIWDLDVLTQLSNIYTWTNMYMWHICSTWGSCLFLAHAWL